MTGSGRRHEPTAESRERYREAVRLYRETSLTVKEISGSLGLNAYSFTSYLQRWHREDVFARRGAEYHEGARLCESKPYRKSAASKYAAAIARLRSEDARPTTELAAEFGLHPECFRQYLKEHEPALYARQGMMRAANGPRGFTPLFGEIRCGAAGLRERGRRAEIHRPEAGAELCFVGRVYTPQLFGDDRQAQTARRAAPE